MQRLILTAFAISKAQHGYLAASMGVQELEDCNMDATEHT